jgi:porin
MRWCRRIMQFALRLQLAAVIACFSVAATAQIPDRKSFELAQSEPDTTWTPEFLRTNDIGSPDANVPPLTPFRAQPLPNQTTSGQFDPRCIDRTKLTGDWWGVRSELIENGMSFDASTTQYYQGVASGGFQQGFRYGGRNDYFLNLDGEKGGLWRGFSVSLHGETRYGQTPDLLTGALLPVNLMMVFPQATGNITALTAVKVSQYLSENLLVYGGRLNMFDTFVQPLTGATGLNGFLNTSMMFNPVYGRTVPYSTNGVGFVYYQNQQHVFSVSVIDTNNTPTVSGFDTLFSNGATIVGTLNIPTRFFDRPGHQGVGGTYSTGRYSELQPTPYNDPILGPGSLFPKSTGSWSLTYNFDQALWVSPNDPKKVWGVFGDLGLSDGNPNPDRFFATLGQPDSRTVAGYFWNRILLPRRQQRLKGCGTEFIASEKRTGGRTVL